MPEGRGEERLVGVISDTHIPTRARRIPEGALDVLRKVDLIIHAGDIVELSVIQELERLAPVVAVHGNMDYPEVAEALPEVNSCEVKGWTIGVVHNSGSYLGLSETARRMARDNGFDALLFGHTHRQLIKREGGVLYLNPGSPTNPMPPFMVKPSLAVLRVTDDGMEPEIVVL